MKLWNAPVETFLDALCAEKLSRAYIITDPQTGAVEASHPLLNSIAGTVAGDDRDYRGHEGCFFEIGRESGHLLSACVHKTIRGQAAGGVRLWRYDSVEDFVRDGLRLSFGMGQKNALAGLWWGGGKGVVARREDADHRDPAVRGAVYRDYGRFLTGLCGCYITAEDAGTTPEDMARVFRTTRYTTCIPETLGGSGNPSRLTATGVVVAMEAALEWLGRGDLGGKTVALQGLGNVSSWMIGDLLDRGVGRIMGADIDAAAAAACQERYTGAPVTLSVLAPGDVSILAEECDVLAPNAVGACLNPTTIPSIQAQVVCGAANNQLEDPRRDAETLKEHGVLYVPDFLANRMGIVNCANEQYGVFPGDPGVASHLDRETPTGVYRRCLEVFHRSDSSGRTAAAEAEALADELSREPHPIWGNRGQAIIDYLVESGWAKREPITEPGGSPGGAGT